METTAHEIADGVYRLSTYIPDAAPGGFTFNQFLLTGDEPLLFHTGPRLFFDAVAGAIGRIMPIDQLRWISFGHVESDECGAMNLFLDAAPNAQVAFNGLGCMVQLNDLVDRPVRVLADGEVLDTGGHRIRTIVTPHVPHGWEAQVMFDETTSTLLSGDLFSQVGNAGALVHDVDLVTPALEAEDLFRSSTMAPTTEATIRGLADLAPRNLALMHGPSFAGDGASAIEALADAYGARFNQSLAAAV